MRRSNLIKTVSFVLSLTMFFYVTTSCSKGPGEGGTSSVKGRVFAVNYNSAFTVPYDSGYIGDQQVYIIYGDDISVGDNQRTNPEGRFEFRYLRKGKYKVYVYTKTKANHIDSAVVQEAEITKNKQTIELEVFRIKTDKN